MSFYSASDGVYGSGEYGTASYDFAAPIISLESVSATVQITATNATISKLVTGVSATGQVGTVTYANDNTELLLSTSATATLGSVTALLNTYDVTVADDGFGTNIYYLRGVAKPSLTFNRGNTYTFDLSDSSNSGHQLAFKDALGNSFTNGVTNTGTPGTAGAKVTIEVDARTFSSLRYYCTVHGDAMGNTITVNYDAAYVAIYGLGEYGKARYGIAFVVETITGVQATGSVAPVQVNGFEIDVDENLDSVSATGSIGSVQVDLTIPVTGVEGVTQQNSIVINATQDLTGVAATGAVNGVGVGNSARPSGVQATGFVNTLAEDVTEALNSVQATGTIGTPTATGVVTVFSATAYDRRNVANTLPQQTSSQRRAA
jgi:hypothetical protein